MPPSASPPSRTPDGRYVVVRGRLWRAPNPNLADAERERADTDLLEAQRLVAAARAEEDADAEVEAHNAVDVAKRALGERGPVWWTDGAPDFNNRAIRTTPYAAWWASRRTGETTG